MRLGHDKRIRKSRFAGKGDARLAPPRLSGLRHAIHLQPVGTMLVRRRIRAAADAARRQRLPVPGLSKEGGSGALTAVIARSVATKQSSLSACAALDCFASLAMTLRLVPR